MLTALVAPATSNLMDPETVLARLKLPESELADLTEQVAEASGIVARYLGFRPEYTTWRETFSGASGDRLYLGARPVWSVQSVTYRDGVAQAADSYRLERGPYGESSILRGWGHAWGLTGSARPSDWPWSPGIVISGTPALPDWSIDYTAGWWLDEMVGEPPAGVERFPRELQADFLRVVRWIRSSGGDLGDLAAMGISKMTNEGASIEFQEGADLRVDPSGIPMSALVSLPLYRRVA